MVSYGINNIGRDPVIFEQVILGFPSREHLGKTGFPGVKIGNNAVIRTGTIIYSDVRIGDNFSSGHNVLIREKTNIGNNVSIGSATIIEGNCNIGDYCNLQSLVYIPTDTILGSHVFIGPNSVLTNDKYPPNGGNNLKGPTIEDYASIGANVTILPGIKIGSGALVAAGSVVTKDVPSHKLAIGAPARFKKLPEGAVKE
jgi:acetyltransferase-like isoleucine patch superfamily enzyme